MSTFIVWTIHMEVYLMKRFLIAVTALAIGSFAFAQGMPMMEGRGFMGPGFMHRGSNLSAEALHKAAAMLPRVAIARTQAVIGKDTVPAMQSGMYWGYIAMIEGLVVRIKAEYGQPMTVIASNSEIGA